MDRRSFIKKVIALPIALSEVGLPILRVESEPISTGVLDTIYNPDPRFHHIVVTEQGRMEK